MASLSCPSSSVGVKLEETTEERSRPIWYQLAPSAGISRGATRNDDRLPSFMSFKNKIMKNTCSFSLQYDRVGGLESVDGRSQGVDTVHGRPINRIDYV